jgi:L-fuculose-phosphate aldolase
MDGSQEVVRSELIAAVRRIAASGLSHGKSGNVSARCRGGFVVTPSALAWEAIDASDLVRLDPDGEVVSGSHRPSTEWPVHRTIYQQRPEVGGIVHAHPPHATALSCARSEIPPFHYMIAAAGGRSIRCAGYARPGSAELAQQVVVALAGRRACLLANHGMISLGPTVSAALEMALEVENLARQYWLTLQIGEPVLLRDTEVDALLEQFQTYGEEAG